MVYIIACNVKSYNYYWVIMQILYPLSISLSESEDLVSLLGLLLFPGTTHDCPTNNGAHVTRGGMIHKFFQSQGWF